MNGTTTISTEVSAPKPPRSRRRRILAGLAIAGVIVCGAGGAAYGFVRSQVSSFTSQKQAELPRVKMSRQRLARVESKLEAFSQQSRGGRRPAIRDLTLSTEEINALVHKEPRLRDAIYIRVEDGQLKADVSVPADLLPGGEGRFFNAQVTFDVGIEDGRLQLHVACATVDGRDVPEGLMAAVRERNFAKPLYNDREIAQLLANIESIHLERDAVRFHLRREVNAQQSARLAWQAACRNRVN